MESANRIWHIQGESPKKRAKYLIVWAVFRNKNCYIKRGCKKLRRNEIKSCYECYEMPCENLDRLDRRYRRRYDMSMVKNLREIKEKGMEKFLESQEEKYRCPECGNVISVHDGKCYTCLRA